MTDNILEPTPEERAYHEGWQAYFSGRAVNSNPYSLDDELPLYEQYENGWSTAQRGDRIVEDDS